MAELKPCPFCGSTKLKVDSKSSLYGYTGLDIRIERMIYSVRCNVCHARGGAIGGLVAPSENIKNRDRLPKDIVFPHELRQKAIDLWNERYTDVCDTEH